MSSDCPEPFPASHRSAECCFIPRLGRVDARGEAALQERLSCPQEGFLPDPEEGEAWRLRGGAAPGPGALWSGGVGQCLPSPIEVTSIPPAQVQTKNVSQCVEYYYIWKKIIKFDHSRAQNADKKAKRDSSEAEEAEEKVENCCAFC